MPLTKHMNPFLKLNDDTGFSNTGYASGPRFINRDGSFNLTKKGWPFWERFSLYHRMIAMPLWRFISFIVLSFVIANLIFTGIYLLLGVSEFTGMVAATKWAAYKEVYFFSTETFTTVGYGRVNPIGDGANLVASFEAMCGFLWFAVITGL